MTQVRTNKEQGRVAEDAPAPDASRPDEEQGGRGAEITLELTLEIRKAIAVIQSQLKEVKKVAKQKLTRLVRAEESLFDHFDDHQMTLFDLNPEISEEVREILDDPRI